MAYLTFIVTKSKVYLSFSITFRIVYMSILPRKILPELSAHIKQKQITVITGLRRTGKTTLVQKLLSDIDSKNKLYLDLQRPDIRELFLEKNYDNIILTLAKRGLDPRHKMYVALDEVQLAPESIGAIKYLYDHYDVKFIITGSSSYYLKNLFTESLAGRKKVFEIFPLDFGEFLVFKGVEFSPRNWQKISNFNATEYERLKMWYEEYVEWGGFPEAVLADSDTQKKDFLDDLITSYVNIDIKSLTDFRKDAEIFSLIKLLASRVGSRLDYIKISSIIGVSAATVKSYIDFLEKTYLIFRVPVWTKNRDREIVKTKKVYFADTGLLSVLAEISSGSKWENALFNQLHNCGEVRYFALKSGREIDFILDGKMALEAKETPTPSDAQALGELAGLAGVNDFRLIGRQRNASGFVKYLWGGEIL